MTSRVELEARTKQFAVDVVRFVSTWPRNKIGEVISFQLLKSATSIGANYREATRAESKADFRHKMAIVEKEASETQYWLELCREVPIGSPPVAAKLYNESSQLLAIFTATNRTLKQNQ